MPASPPRSPLAWRVVPALALSLGLLGCAGSSDPSGAPGFAYELSSDDAETRFLLGREGITAALPAIERGETLGETWTLVSIPAGIGDLAAQSAQIDLSTPGVRISHEWGGYNPYSPAQAPSWVRLDMETAPGTTAGLLEVDRSENGLLVILLDWEGFVDLWGAGESTYFKLELQVSGPLEAI